MENQPPLTDDQHHALRQLEPDTRARQIGEALSIGGGLLTFIAFFLPWFLARPYTSTAFEAAFLINFLSNQTQSIGGYVFVGFALVLLLSAYALSLLSLVALCRRPSVWLRLIPLAAGLLATAYLLFMTDAPGRPIIPLKVGFWLTLLGYLLTFIGYLLVSRRHSQQEAGSVPYTPMGGALSAGGGLLILIAFFLPWFPPPSYGYGFGMPSPSILMSPVYLAGGIPFGSAWLLFLSAQTLSLLSLVMLGRRPSVWLRLIPLAAGLLATVLFVTELGTTIPPGLSVGVWLTLLGYLLAFIGYLLVLMSRKRSQQVGSVPYTRIGDALSAGGGLLILTAFFLPWFLGQFDMSRIAIVPSFFMLRSPSDGAYFFAAGLLLWVALLSAYVLSTSSLAVLYVQSSSRLVTWYRLIPLGAGLLALVPFTLIAPAVVGKVIQLQVGFWLTLLGYLLAFVGCLLVLRSRSPLIQ